MSMPRIALAWASASSASLASLMPPALPRPPIWTWALITTGKPSSSAATVPPRRGRMTTLRHGHAVLGKELLALVFEQVHVSFRPPAGRPKRRGGPRLTGAGRYQQTSSEALASTKAHRFRQPRGLRHPDRLGDRHLRGVPQGGRAGRLHDREGPADPALSRDPGRDHGRVLRAVRRGPAAHGAARGGGAGVGAGARPVELPAEQHPVVGARSGTRMPCSSACGRSTTRIRLRTR